MARSKITLPEYLSFTKKERIGVITIALLILFFIIVPFLFPFFIKREKTDHATFKKEIDELSIKLDSSTGYDKRNDNDDEAGQYASADNHYYRKQFKGELFYFDPNTLSVDGWKRLGIKEKTALTIQKYISKGGKFIKPKDIGKIWGLHEAEVSRLLPYVRIEAGKQDNYISPGTSPKYESTKREFAPIDINAADTSAFIALPGIGSKLASRIIAFREKLGGFYKVEQVSEIYGLHDSSFQKIRNKLVLSSSQVKKLDINTATVDELKTHPYLRYNIANAIVQYRARHGNFVAVTDIKKIMMITEEIFSKVAPYLTSK